MARAAHFISDFKTTSESDRTTDNFLQWLVEKQSAEVALLERLLRAVQRSDEGNVLRVKEQLAHDEKGPASASIELYPEKLRQKMIVNCLTIAEFTLCLCHGFADRGDILNTVGCLT